jgi:hypothetical protein
LVVEAGPYLRKLFFLDLDKVAQPVDRVNNKIADFELYEKLLILPQLGKFQNLNHPKNHGYDGEI